MPLQATSGAASYDGFGGGVVAEPNYIESCFSTYLYTGNGTSQTITNGIDLSGKGGLTWIKCRNYTWNHILNDTVRGAGYGLFSDLTAGQYYDNTTLTNFSSSGFSVGNSNATNENNKIFASWTFRKQPKFFDVVTFNTPSGAHSQVSVNHNLGSTPATIIIKVTSSTGSWFVFHRSLGTFGRHYLRLNATDAQADAGSVVVTANDTTFTMQSYLTDTGLSHVAYLFAHDAGGFGLTGTDNVISCGSYTTDGSGTATVNLGYEPQFVLEKSTGTSSWWIADTMRGMSETNTIRIFPNQDAAESSVGSAYIVPKATGFDIVSHAGSTTYIYIAIRRGPMKVPTSGTSVFLPQTRTGTDSGTVVVSNIGFTPDLAIIQARGSNQGVFEDRLRGNYALFSPQTNAESNTGVEGASGQQGWAFNASTGYGNGNDNYVNYFMGRAPGYFDEVCYTGTGVARTVAHNLAAVPELMIVKRRNTAGFDWIVYSSPTGNNNRLLLNENFQVGSGTSFWNDTTPTSTVFTVGNNLNTNGSGGTYVAYLFATCAGVSKVGSYTGNGTTQTINCGFTGGARFVLIKKTSGTGDWMVSDSARGIVSGNDPYLELNNTNAEVTGEDWLDTDSTGFVVNEVSGSNANTSSATYIFLAVA